MWSNFKHSKTIIYAPMAGYSNSPARIIARTNGADVVVSELIASEGVIRKCRHTWELVKFEQSERPIGIQLFGSIPSSMADAAKRVAEIDPDFIDLNFGCPARKVVDKNGGSSVLKDLYLFKIIISEVVNAVSIPVTVKIRAGWDINSLVYLEAGRIIEDCGAVAVTLHARTKDQGFSGNADWNLIGRLKEHLNIPVIGNGDIFSPQDAARMFDQTGCDAVMIGRGSLGNPWIFSRTKHLLVTGELLPEPSAREKVEMALQHLDMMVSRYGYPNGVYKMRAQFCHYLKGMPESASIRAAINRLLEISDIKSLLWQYLDRLENQHTDVGVSA